MIDYDAVKTATVAWITTVAGQYLAQHQDGSRAIFWAEEAHNYQVEPYAKLVLSDGGTQGQDATVWKDAGSDLLSPRVTGNRQIVVEIEIRSRGSVSASRKAADALRASLYNELRLESLHTDGGMAFVSLDSFVTGAGFAFQGRRESLATLSVRFGVQSVFYDETLTVERVRNAGIGYEIEDQAGNTITGAEDLVGLDYPPGDN